MNAALLLIAIVSTLVAGTATIVAWHASRENSRRSAARIAALAEDIHGPGIIPTWPQREWRVPATVAVLALGSITILVWLTRPAGSVAVDPAAPVKSVASVASVTSSPLELVALSQTMTADGLLVTGRIRNPLAAARRTDVSVQVQGYDKQGQLIARAQHDAGGSALEPGQSTTFAITVPSRVVPATFKVSFRQHEATVPHVDRRAASDKVPGLPGRDQP